MESDPSLPAIPNLLNITFRSFSYEVIIGILVIIILLIMCAVISGSEGAFFSLSPTDISRIRKKKTRINQSILSLLDQPKHLIATILIANNLVMVAIVIISSFVISSMFDFGDSTALGFFFNVVIITFIILLFGEIIPKIYSTQYPVSFASFTALPLIFLKKFFFPLNYLLINSTDIINRKFTKRTQNISIDDISHALELTTSKELKEDEKILKGIVKFGNINVNEIMVSRLDVTTIDINASFNKLLSVIVESGYSRIPIFSGSFDNIKGILYIKDLLPHLHKNETFRWQSLVRPPYYVPETKKINDLLEEFQKRKIHMAIVIDEYGGSSGIVTMEDILEEIVGDITDEFDLEDTRYHKVDDNNYIFEGKILLNDFYKILHVEDDIFDEIKGDADTLAGLILEIKGAIPQKNEVITYKNFNFRIKSVDNRRIKELFVTVKNAGKNAPAE